ncbi:MAG: histidine kinase dimerization/phospho-acceptor domain-containing protein, partial [Dehalococcoidales bacterium]|nr:histidine kinase dimerization/phospho-acceptor domain-containing protein [Dehalococcoidales bacterium]
GLSLEEIIGRRYDEFHSEESTREFAEKVREVIETGKTVHQERWSTRDGRCFLRTFTSVIKRSLAGETSEVVIVSKDITERKLAEKEVIETLQQLRDTKDMLIQFEKHAAVGRLAAGFAHEILNPTSIISSRLQFLGEENLSEQARESLRVCREQIQRIVKISQDLRQSSAKQPRPLVRGDLRRVIDVGLQMMERSVDCHNKWTEIV